jgi:putative hemin transport protein
MLRKHGVQRREAMRLAEGKFTKAVDPQKAVKFVLEEAAAQKLPIMIFAGNRGNLQIHQDKVRTIRFFGEQNEWINVLDPAFNLHLRLDLLKEAWLVEKPTTDGAVHSLECYDAAQELVVQFFGLRKPGIPQSEDWYKLVQELSK